MRDVAIDPTCPLAKPHRRWGECLDGGLGGAGGGNQPNSISLQFQRITFNHGLYTFLLNEEKLAQVYLSSRSVISWAESSLIAENFWPQQLLRIRKLADTGPIAGKRGVYSLSALLKDIHDNAHLLTWENIQAAEPTIAVGPQIQEWRENDVRELEEFGIGQFVMGMQKKVQDAVSKINAISNKFIAHSATPLSIQSDPLSSQSVKLGEFWNCVRTLAKVERSIERYILGRTIPLVAFQAHVGLMFGPPDDGVRRLDQHMDAQREEAGLWKGWDIGEIVSTAKPAE